MSGLFLCLSLTWISITPAIASVHALYRGRLTLASGTGAVARPVAVSVDRTRGEICVTDGPGASLQVFNDRGVLLFRTDRLAGLSQPMDASIDSLGRFVCTDMGSATERTIRRLNFLGEPDDYRPETPEPGWYPSQMIITSDGNYVTLDQGTGMLAKHDARSGALLWKRHLADGKAGEVSLGRPAEGPDGKLYIPGGELHAILVVSRDGELLSSFGEMGSAPGHLIFPVGVGFTPDGTVAVLDRMRHAVLLFDARLRYVTEFGGFGAAPGQFYHPIAIAASPAGLLYVAQGFESRIQIFRLLGAEPGASHAIPSSNDGTAVSILAPETKGASSMP
jgi:DNA-binding beta-propeller fold protein YncE